MDSTVKKVESATSPLGPQGERILATGKGIAMRLWSEDVGDKTEAQERARPYETLGYVIRGSAELHLEGQMIRLEEGDSWLVPKDARHRYKILERFEAVEATHPPAHLHGREEE